MEAIGLDQVAAERGAVLRKTYNHELWKLDTGFKELNRRSGNGLREGDLVVIGVRPAMGGNVFMCNLAYNIVERNRSGRDWDKSLLFFSNNMTNEVAVDYMISAISGVDIWKMRKGLLESEDLDKIDYAIEELSSLSINIDDTTHMTMADLARRVRKANDQQELLAVIIDDIAGILPYNRDVSDYEQKLDEVTHGLRGLVRELKIPIIIMVRLPDYDAEKMDNPRPGLADLQLYGALKEDANMIMFLHRPDYYEDNVGVCDELGEVKKNIIELIIAKSAHGSVGVEEIYFDPDKLKFMSLEDDSY